MQGLFCLPPHPPGLAVNDSFQVETSLQPLGGHTTIGTRNVAALGGKTLRPQLRNEGRTAAISR